MIGEGEPVHRFAPCGQNREEKGVDRPHKETVCENGRKRHFPVRSEHGSGTVVDAVQKSLRYGVSPLDEVSGAGDPVAVDEKSAVMEPGEIPEDGDPPVGGDEDEPVSRDEMMAQGVPGVVPVESMLSEDGQERTLHVPGRKVCVRKDQPRLVKGLLVVQRNACGIASGQGEKGQKQDGCEAAVHRYLKTFRVRDSDQSYHSIIANPGKLGKRKGDQENMERSFSKPTALVTGATGFVGSWVASELLSDGYRVRCLIRPRSDRRNLPALSTDVEWVEGDLRDPVSLRKALEGTSHLFHVAADYRLWSRVKGEMTRTNVEGTRTLLDACLGLRMEKIVYCSSVAALGAGEDSVPITEEMIVDTKTLIGEYKLSKYMSEQVALSYSDRLPVVVVNPSAPIGARDIKPTPTGRIVLDYMRGMMKAYVHTGLNVIHVRDVAKGHLLAARKGRVGERYILANRNLLLRDVFGILEKITGIPAPNVRIPRPVLLPLAYLSEGVSRVTGREPLVPLDGVRMAHKMMFYSGEKAVQELGLVLTPVEDAFRDAVEYFSTPEYLGRAIRPFPGPGR